MASQALLAPSSRSDETQLHAFSTLPAELRLRIIRSMWEPRPVRCLYHQIEAGVTTPYVPRLAELPPVTLQINQEFRYETLKYYKLKFGSRYAENDKDRGYFSNPDLDVLELLTSESAIIGEEVYGVDTFMTFMKQLDVSYLRYICLGDADSTAYFRPPFFRLILRYLANLKYDRPGCPIMLESITVPVVFPTLKTGLCRLVRTERLSPTNVVALTENSHTNENDRVLRFVPKPSSEDSLAQNGVLLFNTVSGQPLEHWALMSVVKRNIPFKYIYLLAFSHLFYDITFKGRYSRFDFNLWSPEYRDYICDINIPHCQGVCYEDYSSVNTVSTYSKTVDARDYINISEQRETADLEISCKGGDADGDIWWHGFLEWSGGLQQESKLNE